MSIAVKIIDKEHEQDLNIKNEPFDLFGRLEVSRNNGKRHYSVIKFLKEEITQICFPDENHNYDQMTENSIIPGAYQNDKCVGIAIMQQAWNRYMYLYDFKVNSEFRRQGVGKLLIDEAKVPAKINGYRGIFTQGQDNNLGACLFYLKNGFEIGGLDTNVYKGTKQEGKADVLFYCEVG